MGYRLPTERIPVEISDGPSVEVTRVVAWPIYWTALVLVSAVLAAKESGAMYAALRSAGAYFVVEAQPSWDITDHRGPVPATLEGFLRLPHAMSLAMVDAWTETYIEKPSAVDEVIEPGPARDELNRRLKAARKAS